MQHLWIDISRKNVWCVCSILVAKSRCCAKQNVQGWNTRNGLTCFVAIETFAIKNWRPQYPLPTFQSLQQFSALRQQVSYNYFYRELKSFRVYIFIMFDFKSNQQRQLLWSQTHWVTTIWRSLLKISSQNITRELLSIQQIWFHPLALCRWEYLSSA